MAVTGLNLVVALIHGNIVGLGGLQAGVNYQPPMACQGRTIEVQGLHKVPQKIPKRKSDLPEGNV